MAIFKYLHKAIALKLHTYGYCMCTHTLTLDNYLIKKKKKKNVSHTPGKSAVLRLGELRGITHTHTHKTLCVQFTCQRTLLSHSSNGREPENYRHGFLPITDSCGNQLSVPINRQNRWISWPLVTNILQNLFFLSAEERNLYRFGTGWVNDRIFIFGWTIALRLLLLQQPVKTTISIS